MSIAAFDLPPDTRAAVHRLADALVPLAAWIAAKTDHVPDPQAPWRNGTPLTAERLHLGDFLAMIVRESSWNADLKERWDDHATDPLRRCPHPDPAAWRRSRGLEPEPTFAVTSSDAILGTVRTREISRMEFYEPYWRLLVDAYRQGDRDAAEHGVALDEGSFALDLLDGKSRFWSPAYSSAEFCTQFVKDVLYCYLGLRNLAPAPFAEAILFELGEGRRAGNTYTSAEAAAAVTAFRKCYNDAPKIRPAAAAVAEPATPDVHGIGSPPVNARDL